MTLITQTWRGGLPTLARDIKSVLSEHAAQNHNSRSLPQLPQPPTTITMATTRLRSAFRYPPDDSDDDELPANMDEEGTTPVPPPVPPSSC